MKKEEIFARAGEKEITRAIVEEFSKQFCEYVETDCLIIGGGPSGLMAGRELGRKGLDRKSTRLNSSHIPLSRMPSSA